MGIEDSAVVDMARQHNCNKSKDLDTFYPALPYMRAVDKGNDVGYSIIL
jgi:hypothetical protein